MRVVQLILISGAMAGSLGFCLGFLFRGSCPPASRDDALSGGVVLKRNDGPSGSGSSGIRRGPKDAEGVRRKQEAAHDDVLDSLVQCQPEFYRKMQAGRDAEMLRALFDELSVSDPLQAAELLQSVADESRWQTLAASLIRSWVKIDSQSAYDWFLQYQHRLAEESRNYFQRFILTRLSEQHPEAASRLIHSIDDVELKESMRRSMACGWVSKNPDAAFRWLKSLMTDDSISPSTVNECYVMTMKQYIELDLTSAAAAVLGLESETLQQALAPSVVEEMARNDLVGAMVWVQQLGSQSARESGMEEIIRTYAGVNPDVVLEYVLTCAAPSDESVSLLCSAFTEVFDSDSICAVGRLKQVPEYARVRVTESIVQNWLEQDERAAVEWICSRPAGTAFDAAASSAAGYFLNEQPAVAFQWALKIGDPARRKKQLAALVNEASGDHLSAIHQTVGSMIFNQKECKEIQQLFATRMRNEYPELILP